MQKKINKWALVSRKGTVKVFNKKLTEDEEKGKKYGYWIDRETRTYYPCSYWKLMRCEVTICKTK